MYKENKNSEVKCFLCFCSLFTQKNSLIKSNDLLYFQADIRSREYLRQHYTEELKRCSCRMQNNDNNSLTEETNAETKEGQNLVHDTCQTFDDLKLS